MLKEISVSLWIGFIWLKIGYKVVSYDRGNETSGSMESSDYLDSMSDY
jgi:hypothetical protein